MLSPGERELQMLRERCAYLQNVVSSSSTTTVLPMGDTLDASGNYDAVPRNPHGNSPPLPFPEIDEKGWFVDKPRNQADFPNVPHWHRKDWVTASRDMKLSTAPGDVQAQRGPTRMSQGQNVVLGFVTDVNGNPVDGQRAQLIRRRFREFCVYLHNNHKAPETWQRGIDKDIILGYHHWMRTQCWELQLCEDNWKADKVAVLSNYTQWKKKYEAKLARRAEKLKAASKKLKKSKQPHSMTVAQADPEFDADQAGAEHVQELLDGTTFRLSPEIRPTEDTGLVTTTRPRTSLSPEPTPGSSKRARRSSSSATAGIAPDDIAPEPAAAVTAPAVVCFPNPLESLQWDSNVSCPSTLEDAGSHESGAVPLPGTDSGTIASGSLALPSSAFPANLPAAATIVDAIPAPAVPVEMSESDICANTSAETAVNVSAATKTLLDKGKGKEKASRKGPKPRKVAASDVVWPPPDDNAHAKLKDICARLWAGKNLEGTREDFDMWYRNLSAYRQSVYAATGGKDGKAAVANSTK
ncbi:hypothetical protein ACG7TL_003415 [Trametes sanguinea]